MLAEELSEDCCRHGLLEVNDVHSALQALNVSNCDQLAALPDLSALTQLRSLNVPDTRLAELPDLSALTQLQSLNVERCSNLHLPPEEVEALEQRGVEVKGRGPEIY